MGNAKFWLLAMVPVVFCEAQVTQPAAYRFLEQSSWGPNAAAVAQVQQMGFQNYLASQFAATPSTISDVPVDPVTGQGYFAPIRQQFFYNAATGQDQLRQRVAFALSEIWVVSSTKVSDPNALTAYLRLIQKDSFGNYRDLMTDITLSAAMGHYLDMVNSVKPPAGTEANQNYARELMQLFTLGLTQLTGPNAGMPTYTPTNVDGLSRAFTGWRLNGTDLTRYSVPMIYNENAHDLSAKEILTYGGVTYTLPANQTAPDDLKQALDIIFNHPNVGPFVCRQLIQHLVTSAPSADYVNRVANVFNFSGAMGIRGDMKAVITAILMDPEARAGDTGTIAPGEGHLMEPVLALARYVRETGATVSTTSGLDNLASTMQQLVYGAPSVFSYFSPGYVQGGNPPVNAPEFQILTTSDAVNRENFMSQMVYNQVGGVTNNLSQYDALAATPDALLNQLNTDLMGGTMPSGMRAPITAYMNLFPAAHNKVLAAVYLITSSWQWQVQQ